MSEFEQMDIPEFLKNGKKTIVTIGVLLVIIITIWKSSITIDAGDSGVLFRPFSGGVDTERTYDEGWHLIAPWNTMAVYDTRQQLVKDDAMKGLSSNGLEVFVDLSAWYKPKKDQLGNLHKNIGPDYVNTVVMETLKDATRSVIGRYTPDEIYSKKRDAIKDEIFSESKDILGEKNVILMKILIKDFTLPSTIKTAIEKKLKQEQESLEYKFKLVTAAQEAEKVRIEAEGKATANKILNASLTANILKEKGLEATLELAKSPNSKVVIVGGKDGLPLILGNN